MHINFMRPTNFNDSLSAFVKNSYKAGVILLLLFCACHQTGTGKKINLLERSPIKPKDSMTQAYYEGKYYSPYIIRLGNPPQKMFFYIDSLYFDVGILDKNNRESYYQKIVTMMPRQDMDLFHLVWNLPELKKLQTADGGKGTIVTRIKERPTGQSPAYEIELLRNDINQMTQLNDITFLRVQLHPQKIEIATQSEYFVSLEKWRKVIR